MSERKATLSMPPDRLCAARPFRRLVALLMLGAVAVAAPAQELKIGGTGAGLATMRLLGDAFVRQNPGVTIEVLPSLGSGGGVKALLAGVVQLAVISRPLQDKEIAAGAVAQEYGRTPFVFATHRATKVRGISVNDLVEIYSGRQERWPDGTPIRLVLRPVGDSDSEALKAISPAMREAKTAAEQRKGMFFAVTDQDAADALEKMPGSLGPTTLALVLSERRELKILPLEGVTPEVRSLADGSYGLYKTMLLATGPKSPAAAKAFVEFARSPAAREILAKNGHWVK